MVNNQSESEFENKRLEQTISLGMDQLNKARQSNEVKKAEIIEAKKEMRENTSHSITGLLTSDGFEALAELSQYMNPVTDKIADYDEVENKIVLLENLIKSPYFARIDFKFDDEDTFGNIYIGRTSLKEDKTHDIYVYDWRSPIASVFYRFVTGRVYYDAPGDRITGEVSLKRQYEINNGKLEYFFDADVQIVDEFLRKLLSHNASLKMKTIVETIQREQDIVIRDMESDLMMVQGVAGSGKTSIALHRAAYLMYQGLQSRLSAHNIIIISPNTLFGQYISQVLPELGENNVDSVVFEEILSKLLHNNHIESRNEFLEKLITSYDRRHELIKYSMEFKTCHLFLNVLNLYIKDLPNKWIDFQDIYYGGRCIATKEELKAKISDRIETPLGMKLGQLEDFIMELMASSPNERINKPERSMIKQEMKKFTELNIVELYRGLFRDKEYFCSMLRDAREGEATPSVKDSAIYDCMEEIIEYTWEGMNSNILHYDDAIAIAYMNLKINGSNKYKNIKQVVIDEAQDYYPLQYEIFKMLYPNSQFTILGDMNQTLEKQEDLSLYDQIKDILNKKKSSLITMDKSFRCTNEILNFSLKFIDQRLEIKSFNREGEEPRVYTAPDQRSLEDMIAGEVKLCFKKGYQSIGLICKTQKNAEFLFNGLKDKLELQLVKNESTMELQGAFVIPVYMSKGLEFDAVLLCDTNQENYNSEEDKKFLYIACTRALHRLNLFCEGEASRLVME